MPLVISTQIQIIVFSFISGIIVGIMFDIYRIIRGYNIPKMIGLLEDLLFWILAAIVVFIFLLYESSTFEIYVYVFITIGTLMYVRFISPCIFKILLDIKENTKKVFRIIIKRIAYLLKISINMVRKR